jgi:uncharacterized membrane protein YgcG
MKSIFQLLTIALFAITLNSCTNTGQHKKGDPSITVQSYKVPNDSTETADDFIYWYMITQSNGSYYYYSSPTPVSDFSSVSWSTSETMPTELSGTGVESLDATSVEVDNLSQDMQTDISADMDSFDVDAGDSDGGGYDGGDSDGGGYDGGGDSGGGDGGGGGE